MLRLLSKLEMFRRWIDGAQDVDLAEENVSSGANRGRSAHFFNLPARQAGELMDQEASRLWEARHTAT